MTANLRRAAGSLLVVGLGGTELTGLERAWLKLVRPAGIILFKRNILDARQTRTLLDEAGAGLGAWVAVRGCGRRNGGPAAGCACADAFGASCGAGFVSHVSEARRGAPGAGWFESHPFAKSANGWGTRPPEF